MSVNEIIAVFFSLLCTILAVKKHILNWPFGIIAVSAYMLLFYKERLYADMILQIVFMIQGFYGWYNWYKNKNNQEIIEVDYMINKERTLISVSIFVIAILWAYLLKRYTNASLPLIDAFASTVSLFANWLMARKRIENWILWIVADIIYVGLFWYKELYLSTGIYFVFLILAIKGLVDWHRKRNIVKGSY
jgi:nicotinamide mononucleotide transporter